MATYWSLDLTMNPTSGNGSNGRFEPGPTLQTAPSPNGPWTTAAAPNTPEHFTVPPGDYVRVAVFDGSGNTLTSVTAAAVFGRNAGRAGASPKASPFVLSGGHVSCVLAATNNANQGGRNAWWTADWSVQAVTGAYQFLVYATATDNQGNQWQFSHDPEMDVATQK
jgi:hypothetical protein